MGFDVDGIIYLSYCRDAGMGAGDIEKK